MNFLYWYVSGILSVFVFVYLFNKSVDVFNRAGFKIMEDAAKNEGRQKEPKQKGGEL